MLPDRVRLRHMLEVAQLALNFIQGVDRATFDQQIGLQFQVTHALEILGEAASTVSPAFQQAHPTLPWSDMKRMRNRLIHAYFNINLDIVWDFAKQPSTADSSTRTYSPGNNRRRVTRANRTSRPANPILNQLVLRAT